VRQGANPSGLLPLPLQGIGIATVAGTFAPGTITAAYLVANPPTPASGACVGSNPPGSIAATSLAATQMVFPFAVTVTNLTAATPSITWAVCVFVGTGTTATQQIQATGLTINAAIAATGITTPPTFNLTAANTPFGSIVNNGTVAFFLNVFSTNNGYPTFFRLANPGAVTTSVFFVLNKGAGQSFNGIATAALLATSAQFLSADQLAAAASTTLGSGQASGSATVKLMSPSPIVQFSAVSESLVTGDLTLLQ
jgi:hypothetical protein